jgi:transcriptional regulator with XRE-family HTH domain
VAEITGQAPKTISDWLRGIRVPHAATLQKFCQPLGILPTWLLHGDRDPDAGVVYRADLPVGDGPRHVRSKDGRESLLALSPAWLAWRFGVGGNDPVELLHATTEDAIPGEIDPDEPVLFRVVKAGYTPVPGEIILLRDQVGITRIWQVPEGGTIPGLVLGTALWTGRRLNRRIGKRG